MAHFPLVPFSGRIRDAILNFRGRIYSLNPNVPWEKNALHGNGWQGPWCVLSRADRSAELELRHDGSSWPWPIRATQSFAIENHCLTIRITLTNESGELMPAGIGLHPWFPAGVDTHLTARCGQVWEVDAGNLFARVSAVPPRWDFSEGRKIEGTNLVNGFTGWDGRASIEWPELRAKLSIEASATLGHVVIYTPPGQPYFCVEPVSHSVEPFNLEARGVPGTGTVVLEPGATLSGHARFAGAIVA